MIGRLLSYALTGVVTLTGTYAVFLTVLTIPYFQNHAIYLHGFKMTWGQDLNVPEQWGFMKNQVTPFSLTTSDKQKIHAWHILPLELYNKHQQELCQEPSGFVKDITTRLSFKLLRDDPEALLVIYLHGAGGTLGSGYRPPSYRAMYAGGPNKIHTIAIDYRGFGSSTGSPSETGLLLDASTLVRWATMEAQIPPSRIVLFAQSIGTAIGASLVRDLARQSPPVHFAGIVFVAPFSDAEALTSTYKIAGTIPLLSPLARFPILMKYFHGFIKDKLRTKDKLEDFVRTCEHSSIEIPKYDITIIHAEDDWDIHWSHSETLFWHAVNGSVVRGIAFDELDHIKQQNKTFLDFGGWAFEWRTDKGIIREEITKYGLHDRIMSYPIVSLAVLRAFGIK
ncbi:hypothetical protein H2198_004964 [Neophaeococcomyces mojaviensis]|uniref:Uncharacterized protein n=1 Tax=Neophaeococcomyces mojaviensis TaxID=3383035 RepID=A0ACC3A732_9EURO|nr:hypothetical protein H2198_004964 [Knufia sp. JES_112]